MRSVILSFVFLTAPAWGQNQPVDGVRLRFGASTGGGLLLAAAQASSAQIAPGEAWDLDVRVGVQFKLNATAAARTSAG